MSFFAPLTSWLSGFMLSPWLFLFGVLAIASPIIIHLLNKRRFKKIEWAAMDFLLEADKKNRRRVRLENFLLLLLRCLAILLIGLLLARPFKSLGMMFLETEEYERVVLLDDSFSMGVREGSRIGLDDATEALGNFVRGLAANDTKDFFTLYVTSDPSAPIINSRLVDEIGASEIIADMQDKVKLSDKPAKLDQALLAIEKDLKGREGASLNRVVYVVSDMRKRDWPTTEAAGAADESGVLSILKRIGGEAAGCFLVDVGREDDIGNLYVENIASKEKALVAGVSSPFEVTVRNAGRRDVNDVKVRFTAAGSVPLEVDVPTIKAGAAEKVPFIYTFARSETPNETNLAEPMPIRVEVVPPGASGVDELQADNTRYFAGRVAPGIKTLIVDGDPSAEYGKSESFYVRRALAPPGQAASGVAVSVVTDVEFEGMRLDEYQVIYLCNLYRVSEARRKALEKWVNKGGGLIIALGNQIDEKQFNSELYREGKGLSPVEVISREGTEEEDEWALFNVQAKEHPFLSLFEGSDNVFVDMVKVFLWWHCRVNEEALKKGEVVIDARLTDVDNSPLVVEKAFGDGRVVVFTVPLDSDWSNWPQDHSFAVTLLELNKYMARKTADEANLAVGAILRQMLDLTNYDLEVSIKRPDDKIIPKQANPPEEPAENAQANGDEEAKALNNDQVMYQVDFDETDRQGFYEMALNRRDGGSDRVLFAANIDSREGDLTRTDTSELMRRFGDANVDLVSNQALLSLGVDNAKGEMWKWVLGLLLAVLFTEQTLAWWFGRKR